MDVNRIVSELDTEIARLQHIRAALLGSEAASSSAQPKSQRGRPKGSTKAAAKGVPAKSAAKKGKRVLSPEGRKRIQEAMKRRWAERSKQSSK